MSSSKGTTTASSELGEGILRFTRRNINVLEERLPAPEDGAWTATSVGMNPWGLQDWAEAGVIEQTGTHSEPGREALLYRTTRRGWRALQAAPERRAGSRLPCGHYGIHNPRGREGVECVYEDCNQVFEKATVREVLDE